MKRIVLITDASSGIGLAFSSEVLGEVMRCKANCPDDYGMIMFDPLGLAVQVCAIKTAGAEKTYDPHNRFVLALADTFTLINICYIQSDI